MFAIQALYVRDILLNRLKLPSTHDEMNQDVNKWLEKEALIDTVDAAIRFQTDYIKDLLQFIDDYPEYNTEHIAGVLQQFVNDKQDNILTYRDKTHVSAITTNASIKHHTEWINEKDDTFKTYFE
ncbi:unnamed protein product [Didymodactylos carnosus]|uniref:Uncharacterized protein n=1 Tax=Didymodactylos carnosus TaxID=1234261 RepID=A0A815PB42_9BILA|nr:unnamed protein product [Didymodactylos carnosus]CAF4321088.1 unnamed protein product [Didymodactylos carnosus]